MLVDDHSMPLQWQLAVSTYSIFFQTIQWMGTTSAFGVLATEDMVLGRSLGHPTSAANGPPVG
jgi:hypothetical protein